MGHVRYGVRHTLEAAVAFVPLGLGDRQDAPIRQQERVAGHSAAARRRTPRNDGRRGVDAGGRSAAGRGGEERAELHWRPVAAYVQRPRASLFLRRQANLADLQILLVPKLVPKDERATRVTRSRSDCALDSGRWRLGSAQPSRWSRCRRVRRCCRRSSRKFMGPMPDRRLSLVRQVRATFEKRNGYQSQWTRSTS